MQPEQRVQRRFHRRQHHRQVFRLAPGHDRVDRHLFHRTGRQQRRHVAQHFGGVAGRAHQHVHHPGGGRRHHGQSVTPIAVETGLDIVFLLANGDFARRDPGFTVADFQLGQVDGIDVQRTAARPQWRQIRADTGQPGQRRPFPLVPAIGPRHLRTIPHADQCRHDLDAQPVRDIQRQVIRHAGDALGEGRIVLRIDLQPACPGKLRQYRHHQFAGRAVPLHDGDKTIRQSGI